MLSRLSRTLAHRGYQITSDRDFPPDYDTACVELYQAARPYTLTSHERVFALREAIRYLVRAEIQGAILECGVWRGGSMFVVAKTLVEMGASDRDLYLFDTFDSTPPPGEEDVDVWGTPARDFYAAASTTPGYAYLPVESVRDLILGTGYPSDHVHFVKGMVEDTIPRSSPNTLALCRLDTDWYGSTAHEMRHLFPRITPGGVLLIDDYGHFQGARRAVDEYFESRQIALLLNRLDFTGRLAVVTAEAHARATTHGDPRTHGP
ncbi:MAG: TylF/MycF/NovP-related O-methyltransferase [Acidimicrobiales bacterium]